MKKITALILALFIMIIPVASCSRTPDSDSGGESTAEIAGETTAEGTQAATDNLPGDIDFKDTAINIHVRGDDSAYNEFYSDAETGEIINDIVYLRNKRVEERLKIKPNVIRGSSWIDYDKDVNKIRSSVRAGDNAYQLISGWSARIPALSLEGLLLNLYETPYIDLKNPWWTQSLVEELTINGKLFFATGDITISKMAASFVLFLNKKVQQEYNVPDLYQTVFDGKWTIDKLSETVKQVTKDLNGDGVMDTNDVFGAGWTGINAVDCFLQGSNIKMVERDDNGNPRFAMEYDKVATIVEKVYNLVFANPGVLGYPMEGAPYSDDLIKMFKSDQLMILPDGFERAILSFRDMETDYGILPYPKFDENQEKYLSRIQDAVALMCIPMNCDKPEAVGAYLEAMGCDSYNNVTPVYFDTAMKIKFTRDENSSRMLDIIVDGAYLNFASIYNESIGYPWHVVRQLISAKKSDFASWYEKNEKVINKKFDEVIEKIQ